MIIDNKHRERYVVLDGIDTHKGWDAGWSVFDRKGSPDVSMDVIRKQCTKYKYEKIHLDPGLWPDTVDYDQNSPGIIDRVHDLSLRGFRSEIEQAFWINVLRVPICVSYLAACAKVRPRTILELGTGGDSAHSTGMFIYWLHENKYDPWLVSVDRHPLSHVWPRYRNYPFWNFIQGDSIAVMKKLMGNHEISYLPSEYDFVFIDSSHTYPHTLKEIQQASYMTNAILLDDSTVPEIKQSLDEFLKENTEWLRIDLAHGVSLIERHEYV